MKTPFEPEEFLNDVMSPDELRTATLECTLAATRRHRQWRRTVRGARVVAACAILATIILREHAPSVPPIATDTLPPALAIQTVPGTNIRLVSDEELLALFPDRPVALVGPPENRHFVFL